MRTKLIFIFAFFSSIAHGDSNLNYRLEIVAQGLNHPWSIAFLPNGDYLVSMRNGELRRINANGDVSKPLANT